MFQMEINICKCNFFAVSKTLSQSRASSYMFNDPLTVTDNKEKRVNQSSES